MLKSTYTTRYGDEVTISRPTYDIQKDLDELAEHYLSRILEASFPDFISELSAATEIRSKVYNIYVKMSEWLMNNFYAKIRVETFSIKKTNGSYIIPEFECFIDTSDAPVEGGLMEGLPKTKKELDDLQFLKIGFNLIYKDRRAVVAKVEYKWTHNCYMNDMPFRLWKSIQSSLDEFSREDAVGRADNYKRIKNDICTNIYRFISRSVLTYDGLEMYTPSQNRTQTPLILYLFWGTYHLFDGKRYCISTSKGFHVGGRPVDSQHDYSPFLPIDRKNKIKTERIGALYRNFEWRYRYRFITCGHVYFFKGIDGLQNGCSMNEFKVQSDHFSAIIREPATYEEHLYLYTQNNLRPGVEYQYIPPYFTDNLFSKFIDKSKLRAKNRCGFFLDQGDGDLIKKIETRSYKEDMINIHLPYVGTTCRVWIFTGAQYPLGFGSRRLLERKTTLLCLNPDFNAFFKKIENTQGSILGQGFELLKTLRPKTDMHIFLRVFYNRDIRLTAAANNVKIRDAAEREVNKHFKDHGLQIE